MPHLQNLRRGPARLVTQADAAKNLSPRRISKRGPRELVSGLLMALGTIGSSVLAGTISIDPDGTGNPTFGAISVTNFIWAPTSFVAKGGVAAVNNFVLGVCGQGGAGCNFDVLSHATMIGMRNGNTDVTPSGLGTSWEITMTMRFSETVTGVNSNTATFSTTGSGWMEWFYSPIADAQALTGFGFNNGRLILRLEGLAAATGSLTVLSNIPVALDGFGTNDYPGQLTLPAASTLGLLEFGGAAAIRDGSFILSQLSSLDMSGSLPAAVPYSAVDPSDCFNAFQTAGGLGSGYVSGCDNVHFNGPFSAQSAASGGYVPVTGAVNGISGPDFDPEIVFTATANVVPEPGRFALALAGLLVVLARCMQHPIAVRHYRLNRAGLRLS